MKFPKAFVKGSRNINVIVETPKGSGNKYSFDPKTKLFKLSKILPNGIVFPHHFGFIPYTKGNDGDPLDVLVFLNDPAYPGCHIECRVIGIIEAEETEDGKAIRNDRIVAVASESHHYNDVKNISDIDKFGIDELINFLVAYNKLSKKDFKPLKCRGPHTAIDLIKKQLTKTSK